jgi:hypothetical protein
MEPNFQHASAVSDPAPVLRKRGRPRGIGRCRTRKRFAIANAVVAGKPIAAVARELGVSRSWASREAHAQGTCEVIEILANEHAAAIDVLLEATLNVIKDVLQARKVKRVRGKVVDLGPDHCLRMKAVGLYSRLVEATQIEEAAGQARPSTPTRQWEPPTRIKRELGFFRTLSSVSRHTLALTARQNR